MVAAAGESGNLREKKPFNCPLNKQKKKVGFDW